MKKLLAVVLALTVLSPTLAFAGGATNAALGLGAFAVFNQIISGTGVFGGFQAAYPAAAYAAPAPVFVAPPPPVVLAPPPTVVVVRPPVAYYSPAPAYYYHAPARVVVGPRWCPPGHMKHGRCF